MTSAAFGDEQITCYVECSITVVLTPLLVTKSLLSEVYGELAPILSLLRFWLFMGCWSNHPNGVNFIFYKNNPPPPPPSMWLGAHITESDGFIICKMNVYQPIMHEQLVKHFNCCNFSINTTVCVEYTLFWCLFYSHMCNTLLFFFTKEVSSLFIFPDSGEA